jgi:DNA topoisomerase-1
LKDKFSKIVDYDFTAELEELLDKVEEGETEWVKVLEQFYQTFNQELEEAKESLEKVEVPLEESDVRCDKCGRMMVYKYGRFGRFLACPGYPECKNTKAIRKIWNVKCPKCGEGEIIERKSKKGRVFFGCNRYPECDFLSWERPYQTACPQCGSMMVVKGGKLDKTLVCLKTGCGYTEKLEKIETN